MKILRDVLDEILTNRSIPAPIFESLVKYSLYGAGIGAGGDVNSSGELYVIKHIAEKHKNSCQPLTVFDVGANVGEYSKAVLAQFGQKATIYCFEPGTSYSELVENISKNPNVRLYNFGLGDKPQTVPFYSPKEFSMGASVFYREFKEPFLKMDCIGNITLDTIDNFCKSESLNHIDLLKLDVEGNEFNVLKGAEKLIDNDSIDYIQFEFGGCDIASRTFLRDFWDLLTPRYRLYRIKKDGLRPLNEYHERLEQFMTTNYLAIHKKVL